MAVRKPLADGDDGSGNRYPVREICPCGCGKTETDADFHGLNTTLREICQWCTLLHRPGICPNDSARVPASLQALTPESVDYTVPACEREA